MTTINLNGSTPFTLGINTYDWGDRFISSVYFGSSDEPSVSSVNLALSGDPWRIARMGFDSELDTSPIDLIITDTNDAVERRIDWLRMFSLDDVDITLHGSRVRYLEAGDCDTLTLRLGSGRLTHADIYNTDSTITLGSGSVGQISIYGGNHVFTASIGWLDSLSVDNAGSFTFTDGTGYFGTIRSDAETASFTIRTGGNALVLNAGSNTAASVNTVNVIDGFLGAIVAFQKTTTTLFVRSGAEVGSVRFSEGNDRVEVRGGQLV
jgi:hypothetical protein